jgi:nucleotide-binding universal stress UspA family protein
MLDITRPIVVGVDGSPASLGAVRWAANEAVRHARALRVAHALDLSEGSAPEADQQRIVLDAAVEARYWAPGTEVTTTTARASPVALLHEQSRQASLIVVGGRGHGGFAGLLLGSVGQRLVAYAECPVLIIHGGERWAGPEAQLPISAPVVVGDDGSVAARHALVMAGSRSCGSAR